MGLFFFGALDAWLLKLEGGVGLASSLIKYSHHYTCQTASQKLLGKHILYIKKTTTTPPPQGGGRSHTTRASVRGCSPPCGGVSGCSPPCGGWWWWLGKEIWFRLPTTTTSTSLSTSTSTITIYYLLSTN